MRHLTANEIVRIWELGRSQHPLEQAITLLAVACPEMVLDELVSLSIGQRDASLLRLRELTFGARLNGFAECPNCCHALEFGLDVADIRVPEPTPVVAEYTLAVEGIELRFRLPNTQDLLAVAGCQDAIAAREKLLQRCLLQVSREGTSLSQRELSPEAIAQLARQMAECDPQAEILLNLTCPVCDHHWQVLLDIGTFFWSEIAAHAKRLLREVHILARFYGWREADILSMSHQRRQFYLEMVEG